MGGLGDAVAGLAAACLARGHHVECMLPFYECIDEAEVVGLKKERTLRSFFKGGNVGAEVYTGTTVEGLPVVLIRPDSGLFKVRPRPSVSHCCWDAPKPLLRTGWGWGGA